MMESICGRILSEATAIGWSSVTTSTIFQKELAANQLDLERSNSNILYEKATQSVVDVQSLER